MSDQPHGVSTSSDSYQNVRDNSLVSEGELSPEMVSQPTLLDASTSTPRNSVAFPAAVGDNPPTPNRDTVEWNRNGSGQGKRTLSELLELHSEKGTDCRLSQEEATRLGDVLGQWINASSSPYEGEDDFFKSHDDIDLPPRRGLMNGGRPRGQSECIGSRPSSSAGFSTV